MRLYSDLANWFHLLTHPSDYDKEAEFSTRIFEAASLSRPQTVLELGSGGGNNAFHLKARFTLTLSDISPEMLQLSRAINPECEHIQGDMRSLRLGRTFDCVFIHDAIGYMVSHEDLRAALETAFVHTKPGGVLLLTPDCTRETLRPGVDCGGHDGRDGDRRSLRYLEWTHAADDGSTTYSVDYAVMLKDEAGAVTVQHDHHILGLFSQAEWEGHLREAGFELLEPAVEDPYAGEHAVFVARRPPAQPPHPRSREREATGEPQRAALDRPTNQPRPNGPATSLRRSEDSPSSALRVPSPWRSAERIRDASGSPVA